MLKTHNETVNQRRAYLKERIFQANSWHCNYSNHFQHSRYNRRKNKFKPLLNTEQQLDKLAGNEITFAAEKLLSASKCKARRKAYSSKTLSSHFVILRIVTKDTRHVIEQTRQPKQ